MDKNFLWKEVDEMPMCPYKPGLQMIPECAMFMGETCPLYAECISQTEGSVATQITAQKAEVETPQ